jgi:hypothetical protein
MSIFKRTQRKYVNKAYRVRNWREYEANLRERGSLTVWISLTDGKLVNWDAPRPRRRKPGRQRKYSNHAIETPVTLGMVFHLSSRQSEGLLRSFTKPSWAQRCEREGWRHRELRQGSGARF